MSAEVYNHAQLYCFSSSSFVPLQGPLPQLCFAWGCVMNGRLHLNIGTTLQSNRRTHGYTQLAADLQLMDCNMVLSDRFIHYGAIQLQGAYQLAHLL